MDYKEALEYIHSTNKFGSRLGLDNITKLLEYLGNPQDKLRFIHVAGTNGKGSTCTMLSYIFTEAGYRTGLYISPFLEDFRERIQLNNQMIPEKELAEAADRVKIAVKQMISQEFDHPTEFEIVTAISMLYYEKEKPDIVILETGLGGRLDATNVIKHTEVSVITSISIDHAEYLGDTVEKIAFEKASIIKENSDIVVYPQKPEAYEVIKKMAQQKNSRIYPLNMEDVEVRDTGPWGQKLFLNNIDVMSGKEFRLNLIGKHQSLNCITVLKTIEIIRKKGYSISDETIESALKKVRFSGRMEILSEKPYIIIDGAHNPDGIYSLAETIKEYFAGYSINMFFGMLADKDIKSALKYILPLCSNVYTLTPHNERALISSKTAEIVKELHYDKVTVCDTIEEAMKYIMDEDKTINIFTGSLYLIGDVRKKVKKMFSNI